MNISFEEAKDLVKKYGEIFPEIIKLRESVHAYCKKTSYTKTIFGRPRKLSKVWSNDPKEVDKALRQSFNTAIQASCADLFKMAAYKTLKYADKDVRFVFGVFDSILLEVPESMQVPEIEEMVEDLSSFDHFDGKFQESSALSKIMDANDPLLSKKGFNFRYEYAIGNSWKECADQL